MPLINFEVSLTLTWSANCVMTNKAHRKANPDADPVVTEINVSTNAMLDIIIMQCKIVRDYCYFID